MITPSRASDTVFSATCDAATAVMPCGAANQIAGKRIAICITPVHVSSHERPSALNTAPGMLAREARPAQIATNAIGAAAARHSSPKTVSTSGSASAAMPTASGPGHHRAQPDGLEIAPPQLVVDARGVVAAQARVEREQHLVGHPEARQDHQLGQAEGQVVDAESGGAELPAHHQVVEVLRPLAEQADRHDPEAEAQHRGQVPARDHRIRAE